MPRVNDGPKPFGSLRHTGSIGVSSSRYEPEKWNHQAKIDAKVDRKKDEKFALERQEQSKRKRMLERVAYLYYLPCLRALEAVRWPDGLICPECQSKNIAGKFAHIRRCADCKFRFDATFGTELETATLAAWFRASFLISGDATGYAPIYLRDTLGLPDDTASQIISSLQALPIGSRPLSLVDIANRVWAVAKPKP
jgi:hypothetical protein